MRAAVSATLLATACLLTACGERAQTSGTRKADVAPSAGTAGGTDTAPGWKAGDSVSWEAQMKSRAQSQNEYARSAAP